MRGRSTYEDDGHVIADMSGIERPRLWIPRLPREQSGLPEQTEDKQQWESSFTPDERRMAVLGALKAALFIALVFIIGLGAAIELMVLIW